MKRRNLLVCDGGCTLNGIFYEIWTEYFRIDQVVDFNLNSHLLCHLLWQSFRKSFPAFGEYSSSTVWNGFATKTMGMPKMNYNAWKDTEFRCDYSWQNFATSTELKFHHGHNWWLTLSQENIVGWKFASFICCLFWQYKCIDLIIENANVVIIQLYGLFKLWAKIYRQIFGVCDNVCSSKSHFYQCCSETRFQIKPWNSTKHACSWNKQNFVPYFLELL